MFLEACDTRRWMGHVIKTLRLITTEGSNLPFYLLFYSRKTGKEKMKRESDNQCLHGFMSVNKIHLQILNMLSWQFRASMVYAKFTDAGTDCRRQKKILWRILVAKQHPFLFIVQTHNQCCLWLIYFVSALMRPKVQFLCHLCSVTAALAMVSVDYRHLPHSVSPWHIQNTAAWLIVNVHKLTHVTLLLKSLHLLSVPARVRKTLFLSNIAANGLTPHYIQTVLHILNHKIICFIWLSAPSLS